jgi:flagellar motor switch protein FliG
MTHADGTPGDTLAIEREVAEVHLLLADHELTALERAAQRYQLTTAQLLRQLVREFLAGCEGEWG